MKIGMKNEFQEAEPKMAEHKIEAKNSQRYKSELFHQIYDEKSQIWTKTNLRACCRRNITKDVRLRLGLSDRRNQSSIPILLELKLRPPRLILRLGNFGKEKLATLAFLPQSSPASKSASEAAILILIRSV